METISLVIALAFLYVHLFNSGIPLRERPILQILLIVLAIEGVLSIVNLMSNNVVIDYSIVIVKIMFWIGLISFICFDLARREYNKLKEL